MTTIRVGSVTDLVPVLPHLLGFVPHRSLVVAGVSAGRIVWLQRADLALDLASARDAAEQMLEVVDREVPDTLVLVAYEDDEGESRPLLAEIARRGADWWEVSEVVVVRAGLLYHPSCIGGVAAVGPVPALPGGRPAASRALRVAGAGCRRPLMARAVEERARRLRVSGLGEGTVLEAWGHVAAGTLPKHPADRLRALAAAAAGCQEVDMRDALIWALTGCTDVPPGTDLDLQARVASTVVPPQTGALEPLLVACQEVDGPECANLLAVACAVAWQEGDGVLAGALVDRVREHAPGHRLAGLVGRCVALGVAPERARA